MKTPELILNIYGQEAWHTEVKIVGSKDALEALKVCLERAIAEGYAELPTDNPPDDDLFASDGEGYILQVHCLDGWDDKRWEEHPPEYQILIRHELE